MNREYFITFILVHNPTHDKKQLEDLSIEALVMIKVQIELELMNKE